MIEQAITKVFDILDNKQKLTKYDKYLIKNLIRDLYAGYIRSRSKGE